MTHDITQQLIMQCEDQKSLKDMGVDPALQAVRQHSATSARFVQILAQLARYKLDVARRDEEMGREVCAAVEARRATLDVGYHALKHLHPLLAEPWSDGDSASDALLSRLASEAEAARDRVETAKRAMPKLEHLTKLHEDAWRDHALERDQALQDEVHLGELRLEGLRAKQRGLERALGMCERVADVPELLTSGAMEVDTPVVQASADAAPLLTSCAELVRSVNDMHTACSRDVLAEVAAIAARISEERHGRQQALMAALKSVSTELRSARVELEAPLAMHKRRCSAEALLVALVTLQAEFSEARKDERNARNKVEDLEDEAAPGDPARERAEAKLQEAKDKVAALALRRDGVLAEVVKLSATQAPGQGLGLVVNDEHGADVELDFPELQLRAQRIVKPFQAYERMSEAQRAVFDIEVLLRRAGLLACDRKYASYSELGVMVSSKPNVKRAMLRGAQPESAAKILKEYGVGEFKRVKRAVTVAGRLRHPGIVPVECAFLEQAGSVVVVQSPLYAGGNMRQWSRGKSVEARLRAAQRVAEAVRFLHWHSPPILHRDLKPENIVFESSADNAAPALCDFDLSVSVLESMTSTLMLGTLLYLAPDPAPSTASDVYSLGMTLFDVIFCDAEELRLREALAGGGAATPRAAAACNITELERVRRDLSQRPDNAVLAKLVRAMLAPDAGERPDASAAAEELSELVHVRTCCVCHCPEPREKGLECGAAARHFACDECFSLHAARLEALGGRDKNLVTCFAQPCTATFSLQEAAKHASQLAFESLRRHIDDHRHVAMQGEFEQWKARYEAEFAAKSEQERAVLAARRHVEEMMDLRCPKCRRVFAQYTGCAALTCAYAGCGAHFCALCLADCGGDAHAHVRTCSLNPKQNEYYVSEAEWARIMDGQRREKLREYWAALEPEVKEALAADASINQIFRDLKLDRLLGSGAFAEQMAQLRGMGFKDERAMRRALSETGGDVAAALGML